MELEVLQAKIKHWGKADQYKKERFLKPMKEALGEVWTQLSDGALCFKGGKISDALCQKYEGELM